MYCYTAINGITCVVNELALWTEISSEHPIFIKTVASLTNKKLSNNALERLNEIHTEFDNLNKKTKTIAKILNQNPYMYNSYMAQLSNIVNEFLVYDNHALQFYPDLYMYGKEDKGWQMQIHHIIHEQDFMHQLFSNIKSQLK